MKKAISKGVIKDILIVAVAVLVIWIGLQIAFGTQNPFYVVASGSMIPNLEVYDVIVIQGHIPFDEIKIGDIIVFDRPSDHNRIIVHRVVSIIDDNPKTIRTQGDANPGSIPGTDFPITEEEYIGKVEYIFPQVGYVTQLLKPPINYIIIVIVVGIMIIKQFSKKKKESTKQEVFQASDDESDTHDELSDISELEKDTEYSNHSEKINIDEDKEETRKSNPNKSKEEK